jgi:3-phosphoshikimate 1-carboxyvinyltransferase
MIAALAKGETRIDNFATSQDCAATLRCLEQLGVSIRHEGTSVWIQGVGKAGLSAPAAPLDCGNSGTTMRLLAGILAGQKFSSVLVGDESLMRRPMRRIAGPLEAMGAKVETTDGHAPVRITGSRELIGREHILGVASAQVKSCILLAGLYADQPTVVVEKHGTRDHTERMFRRFGKRVSTEYRKGAGWAYTVEPLDSNGFGSRYVVVPGDISAAAFFLVAASVLESSEITIRNVGLNPRRNFIVSMLDHFGARIQIDVSYATPDPVLLPEVPDTVLSNAYEPWHEPSGSIRLLSGFSAGSRSEDYPGTMIRDGSQIASMIDEFPVIAVFASQLKDGFAVRDASELRVKETDRIAAIVENLRRMGADVEEFDDGFRVAKSRLKGARVDSFGDHRIAMAFAIAGLMAEEGETEIDGAECVDVSFPGFFDVLQDVVVYE